MEEGARTTYISGRWLVAFRDTLRETSLPLRRRRPSRRLCRVDGIEQSRAHRNPETRVKICTVKSRVNQSWPATPTNEREAFEPVFIESYDPCVSSSIRDRVAHCCTPSREKESLVYYATGAPLIASSNAGRRILIFVSPAGERDRDARREEKRREKEKKTCRNRRAESPRHIEEET